MGAIVALFRHVANGDEAGSAGASAAAGLPGQDYVD
jgi:hypothetical protein